MQRVGGGAGSSGFAHLICRCRRSSPRLNNTAQDGDGPLRQQHYTAIRVHEELDPIARFQPEMLPDSLWNCRLALSSDR